MSYKTELRTAVKAVPLETKNKVLSWLRGEPPCGGLSVAEAANLLELKTDVFVQIAADIIKKSKVTVLPKKLEK